MWRRHARWPTCKNRAPHDHESNTHALGLFLATPTKSCAIQRMPPEVAPRGVDFDVVHRQRHSLSLQAEHRVDRQRWRNYGQALYLVIRALDFMFNNWPFSSWTTTHSKWGTKTPSASSRSRTHGAHHRRSATPICLWRMGGDPRGGGKANRPDMTGSSKSTPKQVNSMLRKKLGVRKTIATRPPRKEDAQLPSAELGEPWGATSTTPKHVVGAVVCGSGR